MPWVTANFHTFPLSCYIDTGLRSNTSILERDCFLKTKTLQMFQDLPYSVRKMYAVPSEWSTVIERPLSTGRLSQSLSTPYMRFHIFTQKVVWRSSSTINSIQICTVSYWKRRNLLTTHREMEEEEWTVPRGSQKTRNWVMLCQHHPKAK